MGFIENDTARTILSLAVMLTAGFLVTRVTKRLHLPNVTGYILAGILIGPCVFGLIPADMIGGMGFVTDIALAFIAFGVGKYFKWAQLKKSGWKILILTGCESLAAGILVTLTMIFVFRLSVPFSLLLGAIGSATAPASTIMTIRQYRAKGPFVNLILQVVALDDAVALLAFSACGTYTCVGAPSFICGPQYASLAALVASICLTTSGVATTSACGKAFISGSRPK